MQLKRVLCLFLIATAAIFIATADDAAPAAPAGEKFEFQAEVSRLMDIIINSLYTNRDIFIRELVSNAADAIDKVRFQSLTDKTVLGEGDLAELDIKVRMDKDKKTLTIIDKGVGMTKEELIKNLGIVAKSGTSDFLEAASKGADSLSLIGQFGVGFYSVYLVANKVTVTSKSNNDDQYIWESEANATFTVAKDPAGNTLGRGTAVTLHLKEDAEEYLSDQKLKDLVGKYSQFISFPIRIHSLRTEETEVVDEEATEAAKKEFDERMATKKEMESSKPDEAKTEEEKAKEKEEPEEFKPIMKKSTQNLDNWEVVNNVKAIWTRDPKEVTDEEYADFYRTLSKDSNPSLTKMHFTAEGEITFRSILYIPSEAEPGLYDKFYEKSSALKLYVRRVMITDDFKDFVPRYMNFVKGVVDSDDLPLNVNRETLAQSRVLKVMSKKITRKVLEMLRKLAQDGKKAQEEEEEEKKKTEEEKKAEEEKGDKKEPTKDLYTPFWNTFGKSIKLGILDDRANKNKLVKLIRFETSKSDGKLTSFEDYVDRMPEKQKNIFYVTGESMEVVKKSPFLEKANKKGIEVIYFPDSLDEYLIQSVSEYDGTPLMSLTKEGLTLGEEKKNLHAKQEEEFKPLTEFFKKTLGDKKVEKVVVSQRLAKSPMVIVTGQYGWSANMERIMKSQAFGNAKEQQYMISKKTLEINPYHPIIKTMLKADYEDSKTQNLAKLLYDAAYLNSGFAMDEPSEFTGRLQDVVAQGLGVDPDAPVDEEPETDLEDEKKPAAAEGEEKVEASDDGVQVGETIQATATVVPATEGNKEEL